MVYQGATRLYHFLINVIPFISNSAWHSPNGSTHNQIDYILNPQRFKSSIISTSTRTKKMNTKFKGIPYTFIVITIKMY